MQQPQLAYVKPASKALLGAVEAKAFTAQILQSTSQPRAELEWQSALGGKVVWVDNVLSAVECQSLCQLVDACPQLSFWHGGVRGEQSEAQAFRDADTIEMNNPELGAALWDRLLASGAARWPPKDIVVSEEEDSELEGRWVAESPLNQDLLFARYPSEGSFAPHTDGRAIQHFNRRSFQSVILFLNDVPTGFGGGTRFYSEAALGQLTRDAQGRWTADASLVELDVLPRAGRLLMFDQELVHEGVPPLSPHVKYIIRSDVMRARTPAVCDSPTDREAYALFRRAEELAEAGEVAESLRLFQLSWSMSPSLKRIMKQC